MSKEYQPNLLRQLQQTARNISSRVVDEVSLRILDWDKNISCGGFVVKSGFILLAPASFYLIARSSDSGLMYGAAAVATLCDASIVLSSFFHRDKTDQCNEEQISLDPRAYSQEGSRIDLPKVFQEAFQNSADNWQL